MLERAMIQRDQLELLLAAVAGAGVGGITGIVLGHEELGTLVGHSSAQSLSAGRSIVIAPSVSAFVADTSV